MVAIKGMEMPTRCSDCPEEGYYERLGGHLCTRLDKNTNDERWEKRLDDCPLVEIVTCQDCKHCHPDEDGRGYHCERDNYVRFSVHRDFFCKGGEKN